jgi:hypothetical protein
VLHALAAKGPTEPVTIWLVPAARLKSAGATVTGVPGEPTSAGHVGSSRKMVSDTWQFTNPRSACVATAVMVMAFVPSGPGSGQSLVSYSWDEL